MANFNVDVGATNDEIVGTLNYLLSNLGSAPFGLTINQVNGEILNVGTNTVTGYLYQYINIGWANNIQGLYFSGTASGQSYYGIYNNDDPTFPTSNTAFSWRAIGGTIGTSPNTYLWYSVQGGRQITFAFADSLPSANYVKYTGVPINLDVITFVGNSSVIGNNVVIGSYATIGTHANIGDYWTAGNFGNIGSNLIVGANATISTGARIGTFANINTNANIAANATIGANLTIGTNLYVNGLITNSVLDTNTVGTTQLVNLSVTNGKLANSSVTTAKIADYTIQANDIANAAITTQQVADYTLLGTNLANSTITTQQILDYTILDQDIANLTITGSKITDYTLVGTKLANATIGSQQITDYSITGTDLANATVTANKLSISTLSSITANAGNITAGTISGSSAGGATTITGYTFGVVNSISNVAITNASPTTISTFTVANPTPTRVMITITGSANHWGFEGNATYYNGMAGNVIMEILYSNSTVRTTQTNLSQGSPTIVWRNSTRYDYRMYVEETWSTSLLLAPDTYTVQLTPYWFYRNNSTGNLVTPTNDTLTYSGRLTTFQANIS
jgi:carbonic anhydrase/acetyltransferase-like protein (isoleucine patch superfamily)